MEIGFKAVLGLTALLVLASPASLRADAVGDNNLCYVQFTTGDNLAAIDYCTKAIESGELVQADLIAALINRGVAYRNTGNLDAAIKDYSEALTHAPDDALIYRNRANAYRELREFEAAESDIDRSLALDPQSAPAWYVRGAIMEAQGDSTSARKFYITALGLDPENATYQEKIRSLDAQ